MTRKRLKIYRKSIENLSNIYRKSIENLLKIYRKSIEMCVPSASRSARRNVRSHTASNPRPSGEMCVPTRLVVCLFVVGCHWGKTKTGFAGKHFKKNQKTPQSHILGACAAIVADTGKAGKSEGGRGERMIWGKFGISRRRWKLSLVGTRS